MVKGDMSSLSIIVFAIDAELPSGYWGFMKKDLWEWMRNNRTL